MSYKIYQHKNTDTKHADFCPFCGGGSSVVYTRNTHEGIMRRRKCRRCPARWSTIEIMAEVIEHDPSAD